MKSTELFLKLEEAGFGHDVLIIGDQQYPVMKKGSVTVDCPNEDDCVVLQDGMEKDFRDYDVDEVVQFAINC